MAKRWKVGDNCWQGYARKYFDAGDWFPEVRPGKIVAKNSDGSFRVHNEGILPGCERKRNPGTWVSNRVDPEFLRADPISAMERAIECVRHAKRSDKKKDRPTSGDTHGN